MTDMIRDFFKLESAGGILLVIAAAIAMTIANSPLNEIYQGALPQLCVWHVCISLDQRWFDGGVLPVDWLGSKA